MISDNSCNKVFFSRHILRFKCWSNLKHALELYNVEYSFLDETKDIWARDFMPIQLEKDLFVSYRYNPDYLRSFQEYIMQKTDDAHPPKRRYPFTQLLILAGVGKYSYFLRRL